MEPQPGSPASPPSPGTSSSPPGSAKVTPPPLDEMPLAPDEPSEEATEQEPGRKSSSSSSSSSSSESSAGSPRHVDVVELAEALVPPPEDEQVVVVAPPEKSADGNPANEWVKLEDEHAVPAVHGAEVKPEDDKAAAPAVHGAEEEKPDDDGDRAPPEVEQAAGPAVRGAEDKPDEWATWPDPPLPAVGDSFSSDGSAGAAAGPTEAPEAQAMARAEGGGAAEFDPGRIPASVFQPRTSLSQVEWSMTSNESLFSIQGASDAGGPYAGGSRSHFDFFYDEAMAASAAAAEADAKLPSVAEGAEPGELAAVESKEFPAPGSAGSHASDGAKKTTVFRRHESGSGGSSSNFSFAFPILAPTSPKKKELVSTALYQPLQMEYEQPAPPPPLEPPASAFVEMTTEAERRGSTGCCCCGCCWFDCSWATCCGWWRCCSCSCCACPSFCRCSWCLCS